MTDVHIKMHISEKVHGWYPVLTGSGMAHYKSEDQYSSKRIMVAGAEWNPLTNLNQAFEALDKFCQDNKCYYTIDSRYGFVSITDYVGNQISESTILNGDLSNAICRALAEATGGEL